MVNESLKPLLPLDSDDAQDAPTTVDWLRQTYGPLLNLQQVATVLDRKPGGVQHAVSARRHLPWVQTLLRGRRKIGRRTLYDAKVVAELIDGL